MEERKRTGIGGWGNVNDGSVVIWPATIRDCFVYLYKIFMCKV